MIDAKELRIGDIVRMLDENGNLKPCKVVGVDMEICHNSKNRGFLQGAAHLRPFDLPDKDPSDSRWCVDIAPIPLTPEILEKNEWRNRKEFGEYWFIPRNEDYELLALDKIEDEYSIYIEENCTNFDYIRYVHQLQHLLWALGLNADMEI